MNKKITLQQIAEIAKKHGYEPAALDAVVRVESNGSGFSSSTGKIIIQFEPHWFKRLAGEGAKRGVIWSSNRVENQTNEWLAFNEAFYINPNAAMQATSIGLFQIMGFHYKTLGFKKVGDMWDFCKESEANQLELGVRFINSNAKLRKALKENDYHTFAYYYNGAQYQKFNYAARLKSAYEQAKIKISLV